MENKKTAVYIRLSAEDRNVDGIVKAESSSVAAQRILIRDYISRNCLSREEDIIEYVDDGFSGMNFSRPAFRKMMDDAKKGGISCIVVKDFSRLGRDHLETGSYLEKIFPLLGIRFISVNDQYDSADCRGMTGGMSVALKNIINAMYSRDLSAKVKSAMATRAARGEYMGAFAPYGYIKDPENIHHLIPDEEAAATVRLVFSMAAQGRKKPEIARYLNQQGVPACIEHFRKNGINRKGWREKEKKLWTVTTIGDMLKNEVYLGKTIWNKTSLPAAGTGRCVKNDRSEWIITDGTHEPLVSQELFSMANARAFTHEKKNIPSVGRANPLLFCPYCGRRITLSSSEKSYRCGQASVTGIPECRTIHVDRDKLENAVLSCVRAMAKIAAGAAARKKKELHTAGPEKEIRKLESEKKRLSGRKLSIYEDYRSGRLTKEQYRSEYEAAGSRILEIEKRIPELRDEIMQNREQMLNIQEQEAELESLAVLQTFDKDRLGTVIHSVQVYSGERIEIIWKMDNFLFKETAGEKEVLAVQ